MRRALQQDKMVNAKQNGPTHPAGNGIRKTDPSILTFTRASRAGAEARKGGSHSLDLSAHDRRSGAGPALQSVNLLSSSPLTKEEAVACTLQALPVSLSLASAPLTPWDSTGSGSSSSPPDSDLLQATRSTPSAALQSGDSASLPLKFS